MSDITEKMKVYQGTKIIKATPMTKKEYCDYRGWHVPADEDPNAKVYLVEYEADPESKPNHPDHEGYISMSPAHVFEKAYHEYETPTSPGPYGGLHMGHGNIGQAMRAMQDGHMVARKGWNGRNMFVFMQVPAEISVTDVVPKMQSLPQAVKDEFAMRLKAGGPKAITYSNQMAIVKADNNINGWAPSGSDALATDWQILT